MAQTVILDLHPPATPVPAARLAVSRRSMRVVLQVACLAGLLAAPLFHASSVVSLLTAQVLCGGGAYLVLRARAPESAVSAFLSVWGVGALVSAASAVWLAHFFDGDLRSTQFLAVVGVLLGAGLGRMRDVWRAAGTQLDAILATLPEEAGDGTAH